MNYTNTEQSKKLLELGLKSKREGNVWAENELRNLLPKFVIVDSKKYELHIEYRDDIKPVHVVRYSTWGEAQADDLLTAIYLMVVSLVEDGFIKVYKKS